MLKTFEQFVASDMLAKDAIREEFTFTDVDVLTESSENRIEKLIKGNKRAVTIHYKDGGSLTWSFTGAQYGWSGKGVIKDGVTKTMAKEFFDSYDPSNFGQGEEWDAKLDRIGAELMKHVSFKDMIASTRK